MPSPPISGRKPVDPNDTKDTSTDSSDTDNTTSGLGNSPVGRRKPVTDTDSEDSTNRATSTSGSHSKSANSSGKPKSGGADTEGVEYETIDETDTESPEPSKGVISPGKSILSHDSQFPAQAYKRGMEKLAKAAAASSGITGTASAAGVETSKASSTDTSSGHSGADTSRGGVGEANVTSEGVSEKDQRSAGATGVVMSNKDPPLEAPLGVRSATSANVTSEGVSDKEQRSAGATGVLMSSKDPPLKPHVQPADADTATAGSKDTASVTSSRTDTSTSLSTTTQTKNSRLAKAAFKAAQRRHLDRLDQDYEAGKSTCSIARRKFAGDTETVGYENEQRWKQIRKQWERELIQPGWNWGDIRKRQEQRKATYMPWDDGTRTRLFENDIQGTKFTYDTSRLGPSATTKSGWVSNHWTDMSVVDVQSSVLALLTDKERETFYANMDKQRRKKKIRMKFRAQRHEQAGNNLNNLLNPEDRQKVYDASLSSHGIKGAMDMYDQIKQMSALGLMSERPDLTITSPLYRPFQTGCLTQGLTPEEIAEGKAPVMLAAPSLREQLSRSDVSRVHKTVNALHSDWRKNVQNGRWTDESTGVTKDIKYMDPWKRRKRENDEDLALRIKDDWVPYMGIVADTLARTRENWDSDDEIELDVHGIMHHEILAMANKVLGIPDNTPGNEWQNGEMRPMELTIDTDGFAGQEGSTLSAQVTKVWNPLYPRKYNMAGLDDLPKELDGHRDRQKLLERLTRRVYTSFSDKFKPA